MTRFHAISMSKIQGEHSYERLRGIKKVVLYLLIYSYVHMDRSKLELWNHTLTMHTDDGQSHMHDAVQARVCVMPICRHPKRGENKKSR